MNSVAKQEEYNSSTILPNIPTTLTDDLNFTDVITNPFFYGSFIIIIFLLLCIITFIIILKNKSKLLFSTT